jgi:hypothetical protein
MSKTYRVRGAGVDSGILAVFDIDTLGEYYRPEAQQTQESYSRMGLTYPKAVSSGSSMITFKIPKGVYSLSYKLLNNSPELKNSGTGTLKVTSGTILAGDPMYVASDDYWEGITKLKGAVYINDTGGDGTFDFDFTLKRR